MRRAGFTLVEVALLLGLLGIVVAVVVPTFVRTLRVSKISEVTEQLAAMQRSVASYYATARTTGAGLRIECLPEAAGPAPATPSAEPVSVDFLAPVTPGAPTWRAIGFHPTVPIRYRYTLLPSAAGCGVARDLPEPAVTLRAEGDLDADGVYSRFEGTAVHRDGVLAPGRISLVRDRVE